MIPQPGGVCPSIGQVLAPRGVGVFLDILRLNQVCRFSITVNFFPYSSLRLTNIGTLFRGRGNSPARSLGSSAHWRHRHCVRRRRPLRPCALACVAAAGRRGTSSGVGFRGNRGFDCQGRLRQTRSACIHQRAARFALPADILGAGEERCARCHAAGRRRVLLGDGDRSGGDDRGQPQSEPSRRL